MVSLCLPLLYATFTLCKLHGRSAYKPLFSCFGRFYLQSKWQRKQVGGQVENFSLVPTDLISIFHPVHVD